MSISGYAIIQQSASMAEEAAISALIELNLSNHFHLKKRNRTYCFFKRYLGQINAEC